MPVNQKVLKSIILYLYDAEGRGREGQEEEKVGRRKGGRRKMKEVMERKETLLLTNFTRFNTLCYSCILNVLFENNFKVTKIKIGPRSPI